MCEDWRLNGQEDYLLGKKLLMITFHEIDGSLGSHGLDMPEDRNVVHLYKGYPRKK